jgi:hypothetical protein
LKSTEEFFQEFEQLALTAEYKDAHYDDVLTKLLQDNVKASIINAIHAQHPLPTTYTEWKTQIIMLDSQVRRRAEQKMFVFGSFQKPTPRRPDAPLATQTKTGTGVVYGGQGQKMDLNMAKAQGACFQCGQKGHMAQYCPQKRTQVQALVDGLSEEERKELMHTLGETQKKEDF